MNLIGSLVIVGLCVPINCTSDGVVDQLNLLVDSGLTSALMTMSDDTLRVACTDERTPWMNSTMTIVVVSHHHIYLF